MYYYYHGPNPKHSPGLIASEAWLTDPDTRSHDKYLEHSAQQQRLSQLGAWLQSPITDVVINYWCFRSKIILRLFPLIGILGRKNNWLYTITILIKSIFTNKYLQNKYWYKLNEIVCYFEILHATLMYDYLFAHSIVSFQSMFGKCNLHVRQNETLLSAWWLPASSRDAMVTGALNVSVRARLGWQMLPPG